MTAKIPMVDLEQQTLALWPELERAVLGVLRSGRFILGPNVEAFEREAAAFLGVRFAIGVGSGTDALVVGLRALGIGPGDEVIVPSFTFFATAEAVSLVGATPVFAEIDPASFCLDPAAVRAALSPRTRAVIPVHLFGQPADMAALREIALERRLVLLEDAAQAFGAEIAGARIGSLGDAAAFSFFPSKNLGAFGEAGLIATNDERTADSVRSLRAHGSRQRYVNTEIGYNARLDEIQASLLRVKLPHVERWNDERRRVAAEYTANLRDLEGVTPPVVGAGTTHVFHQYTLRIAGGRRDAVSRALAAAGIASQIYYPIPIHQLPVYAEHKVELPITERCASEVLSLPIFPELSSAQAREIARRVREAL